MSGRALKGTPAGGKTKNQRRCYGSKLAKPPASPTYLDEFFPKKFISWFYVNGENLNNPHTKACLLA
jgi:hypothetical protein